MRLEFIVNLNPEENFAIKNWGLLVNPFCYVPYEERAAYWRKEWLKSLEAGFPHEHLKRAILGAGMSEEVADRLYNSLKPGGRYKVIIDSDTMTGEIYSIEEDEK